MKITDLGIDLKKGTSKEVYEEVTASQIAQQIADKYSLVGVIDTTTHVYDSLAQGGKTDYELLSSLAGQEEDGEFQFYTHQGTLFFQRVQLDTPAVSTYTWRDAEGTVQAFQPRSNAITKDLASASVAMVSESVASAQQMVEEVNEANEPANVKFGEFTNSFNKGKEKKSKQVGKQLFAPATNQKMANNIAAQVKKTAQRRDMTASLSLEGDPKLRAGDIITMSGVAKRHRGNWYVEEITHQLGVRGSFTTSLNMWKNGAAKSVAPAPIAEVTPAVVNDTVGEPPEVSSGQRKLRYGDLMLTVKK